MVGGAVVVGGATETVSEVVSVWLQPSASVTVRVTVPATADEHVTVVDAEPGEATAQPAGTSQS